MMEIRNLSCGYGHRPVVSDVSLRIPAASLTFILGRNGTGKTTLLKTLLRLIPPIDGVILVNGRPWSLYSPVTRAQIMAYVPQQFASPFPITVGQAVLMGRTPYVRAGRTPGRLDRLKSLEALRMVGLEHLRDRPVTKISGGERRLVLIARALAQEASFLLLDEPTAQLDLANTQVVLDVICSLRDSGIGILCTCHDPNQVLSCDGRILALAAGSAQFIGTARENLTGSMLSRIYGIDIHMKKVEERHWAVYPALQA